MGNPGRVVVSRSERKPSDMDQVHLPDPVMEQLQSLRSELDKADKCIARMIQKSSCANCKGEDATCPVKALKKDMEDKLK